ncbi:MAG: patatin-like phospholipase family protein [Desulfarculus sp.]|nr:patatin-like phospholipase family protein [Pseudomonadota bacterium]MBV1714568.1 patatin-like phospholipase family protein [Desulfarculus sp.]MBU4576941.1 patatin-like phospholipase family protein [Pseudomonadota bacterium]MBU4599904.1 patatin-like phospholipase family protein [Pseudomonadota bacterium]MBV1740105.1 patatin-like phospholipase family protein [Desulfarculus sp.]
MTNQENAVDLRALPRPVVAVMSSGFFGFFAHAGFLQGLADLGLTPDAYAGSSSGALVAAFAAGGASPQRMLELFSQLGRRDFWDPPSPADTIRWLLGGLKGRSGYLAGEAFERLLGEYLPATRFEDCPKPCLMSALDLTSARRVVLTSGSLPTAVRASGAVPALFAAVPHQGGLLVDGGLIDKAPLTACAEHLGAASLVVHILPSSSLERTPAQTLALSLAPVRIQSRSVDAARWQMYLDQKQAVMERGLALREVLARDMPRCGPKRMHHGPAAFAAARQNAKNVLGTY